MKTKILILALLLLSCFSVSDSWADEALPKDTLCLESYIVKPQPGIIKIGDCYYYYEYYVGQEVWNNNIIPAFQVTKFGLVANQSATNCPALSESDILGQIYAYLCSGKIAEKLQIAADYDQVFAKTATCYKYAYSDQPTEPFNPFLPFIPKEEIPVQLLTSPIFSEKVEMPDSDRPSGFVIGYLIPVLNLRIPCDATVCCYTRYYVKRQNITNRVLRLSAEDRWTQANNCIEAPCNHYACDWQPTSWIESTPIYGTPIVSPNPFSDVFKVELNDVTRTSLTVLITIEVIDAVTGEVVLVKTFDKTNDDFSVTIATSGLPKGAYIV